MRPEMAQLERWSNPPATELDQCVAEYSGQVAEVNDEMKNEIAERRRVRERLWESETARRSRLVPPTNRGTAKPPNAKQVLRGMSCDISPIGEISPVETASSP